MRYEFVIKWRIPQFIAAISWQNGVFTPWDCWAAYFQTPKAALWAPIRLAGKQSTPCIGSIGLATKASSGCGYFETKQFTKKRQKPSETTSFRWSQTSQHVWSFKKCRTCWTRSRRISACRKPSRLACWRKNWGSTSSTRLLGFWPIANWDLISLKQVTEWMPRDDTGCFENHIAIQDWPPCIYIYIIIAINITIYIYIAVLYQ